MDFLNAFRVHESTSGRVCVEPPDLVIVEGPALPTLRIPRANILESRAMLAEYYRRHFDPSYPATNEHDIVVVLRGEGLPAAPLGPFPHAEGISIGEAIDTARRDLFYAVPSCSIGVSADRASLMIRYEYGTNHIMTPVPTLQLVAITVREDDRADVRHAIPTRLAPSGPPRWAELSFLRGKPWLVGPLSVRSAERLARAFALWREAHPLDREPVDVTEAELRAEPTRWHMRRVCVTGLWRFQFESSSFAGVWLRVPEEQGAVYGIYRVRVTGTWLYADPSNDRGYGHMGGSAGELSAETCEILEVIEQAHTATRDGLTQLLNRRAFGPAFARERALAERGGYPLAVAMLDLDHFKRVNDTHGHVAGDEVLRAWARAVTGALRERDVVARWSGEEIAVVLPEMSLEAARGAIERVLEAVRALAIPDGKGDEIRVTFSAGVVVAAHEDPYEAIVARVDKLLYEAKRAGRNRVVAG